MVRRFGHIRRWRATGICDEVAIIRVTPHLSANPLVTSPVSSFTPYVCFPARHHLCPTLFKGCANFLTRREALRWLSPARVCRPTAAFLTTVDPAAPTREGTSQ